MKAAARTLEEKERPREAVERFKCAAGLEKGTSTTVWFWAAALFTSALLLFAVQPMVARMLLPQLGGTPTVWNTCMVFFQILLLAGYAYAHLITRLAIRRQWVIHGILVCVALFTLPIALPESVSAPGSSEHPTLWLLKALFVMAGAPFFVISSTGPLLQNWFSRTRHPSARDPYFLYGASNLGSLVALVSYPVLLEPMLRLTEQSRAWFAGYAVFLLLIAGCAFKTRSSAGSPPMAIHGTSAAVRASWRQRLLWVLLALVPSSLMLGVTSYLTTDIASVPLLWVVPLAFYLLSFIVAFARSGSGWVGMASKALPISVVALIFLMLTDTRNPAWLLISLHLLFFFLAALLCHKRLADSRPAAQQLTEFYLWVSVGGAVGGAFNALVAPVLFKTIAEYPLAIVAACMLSATAPTKTNGNQRVRDWGVACGIAAATAALARLTPKLELAVPQWTMLIIFGLPLLLCYFLSKRPVRFALALGGVILGAQQYTAVHGKVLHAERNFFGAVRVTLDPGGELRRFYHGTTVHGCQFIDGRRRNEPLAYYHRTGPFGIAYEAVIANRAKARIAAIGLGAGAVAAYARPGEHWTFYEIDPAVIRIARDTNFFTYLANATNAVIEYRLGDARLRLREAPERAYDMIICDAFSSDVPPLHLLTREAMELYLSKLSPDGALLYHVSSRYLNFSPVIAGLADSLNLHCLEYNEAAVAAVDMENGKYPSHWVAVARSPAALGNLVRDPNWVALQSRPGMWIWTDDYSNLLAIFDWR